MKKTFLLCCCFTAAVSFNKIYAENNDPVFVNAAMPSLTKDKNGIIYMLFAKGNGLYYAISADKGAGFSSAMFIDSISGLVSTAGRGPLISYTKNGLNILALDKDGNIYSYTKAETGTWIKHEKVNDAADVAKEGFLSVAAKEDSLYAVWLDLRGNDKNKIAGALSADGGKTWQKNKIIYESPSGTVCECCKPSVVFGEKGITVMFRNSMDGNRDLYIIQSSDGGNNFSGTMKLGKGTWKLNACPMDGGGLRYSSNGSLQTIWRRRDTVFVSAPGMQEQMIGKGRNCSIENISEQFIYSWIEDSNIVCLLPGNKKINIGEGSNPVLKAIDEKSFLCVWQYNKNIYSKLISL